jgi:uncharacterized protein (DUF433 family)
MLCEPLSKAARSVPMARRIMSPNVQERNRRSPRGFARSVNRDRMSDMEATSQAETAEALSPMEGRSPGERIVTTPGVRGGKPRIAGHRITVSDVAIWHQRMGMSPDEIVSEYPTITLSDVHAALAYYFDHRDEVDREIRDGEEFAEKLRAGAPSILEELEARKVKCPGRFDSILMRIARTPLLPGFAAAASM